MIKQYSQQNIRFITVEKSTAWVVVALLVETRGNETFVISEPRVVKVIPKETKSLKGKVSKPSVCALNAPNKKCEFREPVVSPYAEEIFFTSNFDFIVSLAARPPTY